MNNTSLIKFDKEIINKEINELYNNNITELKKICKENKIKKYSGENKQGLITLIFFNKFPKYKTFEQTLIEIELINKLRKGKGMSKSRATHKKKSGHSNEDIFAQLINGYVIKGTGKTDVKKDTINISCKKECKRIQFALYAKTNAYITQENEISSKIKECIDIFPSKTEYKKNKLKYKELLKKPMRELCSLFKLNNNIRGFLKYIIFNNEEVDYLSILHNNNYLMFEREEVLDILVENIKISNSKARNSNQVDDQKVIFKVKDSKNKYINIIENEIRNDKGSFLCVSNTYTLIDLLVRNIKKTKTNEDKKLIFYGNAIKIYNDL